MALMCFHTSRSDSRLTVEGEIILLPMQDRRKWDRALIEEGNQYMNKAAFGDTISTYHLEAAIAYETLKQRDKTLELLRNAPIATLQELNHQPDVKELQQDPRFQQLLQR